MVFNLNQIPFHPAIVHFPVALLSISTMVAVVLVFRKDDFLKSLLDFLLLAGLATAFAGIISGMIEEFGLSNIHPETRKLLQNHEIAAYVAVSFYTLQYFWLKLRNRIPEKREFLFFALLSVLSCGVLFYQGYLGGLLVFEKGMKVKKNFDEVPLQ